MNIVVVGGGNLGHAISVALSGVCEHVGLLTQDCAGFGDVVRAQLPSGEVIQTSELRVSDQARDLIPNADIVILTVPSHMIGDILEDIGPYVHKHQCVGSVVAAGGFFWIARSILGQELPLFAFQRVPFICRVIERGALVDISGFKEELYLARSGWSGMGGPLQELNEVFEKSFRTRVLPLDSYLEATISNSNPILHTSRLYSLLAQDKHDAPLYFYRNWDQNSSEVLLACDDEIVRILEKLPIDFPLFKPLRQHYGVADAEEMTRKLSSIEALGAITFPLNERGGLEATNRYFVEDVPFGLVVLRALAQFVDVETPNMDKVIRRLQGFLGKQYLSEQGVLDGRDIKDSGIPQNSGIASLKELLQL